MEFHRGALRRGLAGKTVGLAVVLFLSLPSGGVSRPRQLVISYIVNSTGDGDAVGRDARCDDGTGKCTLRAAIHAANIHAGDDRIEFSIPASDPFCSAGSCTINLTQALPDLSTNISVTGPGADNLTVRPGTGGTYRVFSVKTTGVVTLSGLTIANGKAVSGSGGGILNSGSGTVNVSNCTVSGNFGFGTGAILNVSGTVNISNSTVRDNSSPSTGVTGGIANGGMMNITNSTISGNSGGSSGGGINNNGGT